MRDLIIDAILGTGFRPPVTGLYAEAIAAMNAASAPIIAVDIPSGADADATAAPTTLVARADGIVTFTAPRPAHVFAMLTQRSGCGFANRFAGRSHRHADRAQRDHCARSECSLRSARARREQR